MFVDRLLNGIQQITRIRKGQKRRLTITLEMEINHRRNCQKVKRRLKNTPDKGKFVPSARLALPWWGARAQTGESAVFQNMWWKLQSMRKQSWTVSTVQATRGKQHFFNYKVKVGATNTVHTSVIKGLGFRRIPCL